MTHIDLHCYFTYFILGHPCMHVCTSPSNDRGFSPKPLLTAPLSVFSRNLFLSDILDLKIMNLSVTETNLV